MIFRKRLIPPKLDTAPVPIEMQSLTSEKYDAFSNLGSKTKNGKEVDVETNNEDDFSANGELLTNHQNVKIISAKN